MQIPTERMIGQSVRGDRLRALLALLVLAVAVRFMTGLLITPAERYSLDVLLWAPL